MNCRWGRLHHGVPAWPHTDSQQNGKVPISPRALQGLQLSGFVRKTDTRQSVFLPRGNIAMTATPGQHTMHNFIYTLDNTSLKIEWTETISHDACP